MHPDTAGPPARCVACPTPPERATYASRGPIGQPERIERMGQREDDMVRVTGAQPGLARGTSRGAGGLCTPGTHVRGDGAAVVLRRARPLGMLLQRRQAA